MHQNKPPTTDMPRFNESISRFSHARNTLLEASMEIWHNSISIALIHATVMAVRASALSPGGRWMSSKVGRLMQQ